MKLYFAVTVDVDPSIEVAQYAGHEVKEAILDAAGNVDGVRSVSVREGS